MPLYESTKFLSKPTCTLKNILLVFDLFLSLGSFHFKAYDWSLLSWTLINDFISIKDQSRKPSLDRMNLSFHFSVVLLFEIKEV